MRIVSFLKFALRPSRTGNRAHDTIGYRSLELEDLRSVTARK